MENMIVPLKRKTERDKFFVNDVKVAEALTKYFSRVFTLEELGNISQPKVFRQ